VAIVLVTGVLCRTVAWNATRQTRQQELARKTRTSRFFSDLFRPVAGNPDNRIHVQDRDILTCFFTSYYAYPADVSITDKNVPINTAADIEKHMTFPTVDRLRARGITHVLDRQGTQFILKIMGPPSAWSDNGPGTIPEQE